MGAPGRVALSLALIFVVGWPALATVLEATRAGDRLDGRSTAGWTPADALARWQGSEP